MKKFFSLILTLFTLAVGQMWGAKITNYNNIVSGNYYIGATTGGTDYYLSVDGSNTSSSIAGTAVTSKASATVFSFSGSGTSWTIQFSNGNYLSLNSSKDNGKVQVVSSASTFTASNQSSELRLTIGSYSIQKNNSGTQFGSYGNTQTDIWLESAAPATTYTLNYHDGDGAGTRTSIAEGSNLITSLGTPANSCDATSTTFVGWSTTEITSKTNTKPTFVAANAVVNSTTAAATYYAVYAKGAKTNKYIMVASADDFVSGAEYLVDYYASSTDHILKAANANSKNYQQQSVTSYSLPAAGVSSDDITDELLVWTITSEGNNQYSFYNAESEKYLILKEVKSGKNTYNNLLLSTTKETNFKRSIHNDGDQFKFESSAVSSQYISWTSNYFQAGSGNWLYLYKRVYSYSDYITTCCTSLGSINGSFFWTTHFYPVWPEKHRLKGYYTNLGITSVLYRIPHHLIYTMYISRDFE